MKIILGFILSLVSTISVAHISAYPRVGVADAYALITFNVPHSCYGSATKSVRITQPISGLNMRPAAKANWDISVVQKDSPVGVYHSKNEFGEYYKTETVQVTWTGILPEGFSEQFVINIKTPKDPQIIGFEVQQICEDGRIVNYTKDTQKSTKEIIYETPVKFEVKKKTE